MEGFVLPKTASLAKVIAHLKTKETIMKFAKYVLIPALATVALSAAATTYVFVPANDRVSTKLCVAAGNNKVSTYKHVEDMSRLSSRYITNKMTCNDQDIVSFSTRYGAMKTAAYINRHNKHRVTISDLASAAKQNNSDEVIFVTVE